MMMLMLFIQGALAGTAVISAGSFVQGTTNGPDNPERSVELSPFRVDQTEVSIDEFEAFVAAGYHTRRWWTSKGWAWATAHPDGTGAKFRQSGRVGSHPVVAVTWYEADAYCRWKGGRLPTEAQWERMACGGETTDYVWGDSTSVDAAWYAGGKLGHVSSVATVAADQQSDALKSPEGVLHASGNVWEWTADWYSATAWSTQSAKDPQGPKKGTWRTLRGGSYANLPSYCSCRHREPARPNRVALTTGFRCVYSP